ncbi:hypothetical protein MTX78_23905 (plasmid) [Hymenobacter tibetensis]|uniref:Uncharacterized protein n=1 Tax=Hymenobacter tibetensis TaxID=497967 RepID=A0ABY4D4E1_9BACT|nr:hypothetical protein [Hymenobacter tibetensis]UOG77391.1 hypothetical protein MTX78_23905 [Hymenobacter tibetensis]
MSVFTQIDERLQQFAAAQHTVLTRDRENHWPGGPGHLGFEERRIDWQQDGCNLAVIIQPDFGKMAVDSSQWHFYALAWQNVATGSGRRVAKRHLVNGRPFSEIKARIEELLIEAGSYLHGLQARDLRP